MHPELIRALAKARHEDLLSERRFQGHPRAGPADRPSLFSRSRQLAGSMLIWAGARVIGDKRARLELTPK
jgi:hypothetical protein